LYFVDAICKQFAESISADTLNVYTFFFSKKPMPAISNIIPIIKAKTRLIVVRILPTSAAPE
jgi:hypothetical protein